MNWKDSDSLWHLRLFFEKLSEFCMPWENRGCFFPQFNLIDLPKIFFFFFKIISKEAVKIPKTENVVIWVILLLN